MLTRLSTTLRRYAYGWLVLVLLAAEILFNAVILPGHQARMAAHPGSAGLLDARLTYTPETAYRMIASYGAEGREAYRLFELTGDILYPIVYTLFFSLAITWLFQRGFTGDSRMHRYNVVPFGTWFFDLLENFGIVAMLTVYPSAPALLAWVTAVFTLIKWLFAGASVVLFVIGLVAAIRNGFRKQA